MAYRLGKQTLIYLAALATLAVKAHAGDLSIHAGYVNPGDLTVENVTRHLDGSGIYGVRFGGTFARIFGVEETLAYSPNFLRTGDFAQSEDVKGFITSTNFVLSMPSGYVIPYATVGVGTITRFGSGDDLRFGTKFAVNYGGGVKLPRVAGPLGLRFDARGYRSEGIFSESLNLFEVSAGVIFTFGR
jgi:Outer membrane protein beta-barrel domain